MIKDRSRKHLITLCLLLTIATIVSLCACGDKKKHCAKCGRSEDETELFLFSKEDHPGGDGKYYCATCYRVVYAETPIETVASEIAEMLAETEDEKPRKLVNDFMAAFDKADYATMKSYSSLGCKSAYFHDNDVYGMRRAKVTETSDEKFYTDKFGVRFYSVYITADAELASGETTTKSFYLILLQDTGGHWSVHQFSDEPKY